MDKIRIKWHRLTHWEYWPSWAIYGPLLPVWLYYAFRARSLFFFNTSNPNIINGGFLMETKKEIYDAMPDEYIPKTIRLHPDTTVANALEAMREKGIDFPCIAKPDIGMQGLAVAKLSNAAMLASYIEAAGFDFLVQEYIDMPYEVGVFYYRFPDEAKGHVSGVVYKEYLSLCGNGRDTIAILLGRNPRYAMQLQSLSKQYGRRLDEVLSEGEQCVLVPYGNHARGAKFTDATHWADEVFSESMDKICHRIPGFYFGRLDIKYRSFESLRLGRDLCIIELNGAGSEPTHMYDPSNSLFNAWREITKHWKILFRISVTNHRRGHAFMSWKQGVSMLLENRLQLKQLRSGVVKL